MNVLGDKLVYPHDHFFRTMMSDQRVARDFLTVHLPQDLLQITDLNCLILQPRSYIDELRKETIVDILYQTKMDNHDTLLYLVLEHQSQPDKLMPFRMLKYSCNVLEQHIKKTKKPTLPLIYTIVVYHGTLPYPYSADIKDNVDAPRELVERYFLKPFHLIDLGKIEDEELKRHAWAGIMEFGLKHIFERNILSSLEKMAENFRRIDLSGGRDYISIMLQYILGRAELKGKKEAFFELVNTQISAEVGGKIMSLAKQFWEEGLQQGKQQGREQGIEQGIEQGLNQSKYEIAKRLLAEKSERNFVSKVTGLPLASIDELAGIESLC